MRYEIIFAPEAIRDLKRLQEPERSAVRRAIETHLRHEPAKVSRSRVKRLRGLSQPQFRLRVRDTRVFYDVREDRVEVLAIVFKADAAGWLAKAGKS